VFVRDFESLVLLARGNDGGFYVGAGTLSLLSWCQFRPLIPSSFLRTDHWGPGGVLGLLWTGFPRYFAVGWPGGTL
jgi:hypothetical protein